MERAGCQAKPDRVGEVCETPGKGDYSQYYSPERATGRNQQKLELDSPGGGATSREGFAGFMKSNE